MGRSVTFVPDGKRIRAEASEVVCVWRKYSVIVPAQYALATAQHETDLTLNECDVEPSGFTSMGIFQVSREEMQVTGHGADDVYQLDVSCSVLSQLAEKRLIAIMLAASLPKPTPDCWFYLGMAHNMGLHATLNSIRSFGCNALAWTSRNVQLVQAVHYFSDCINGGSLWSHDFDPTVVVVNPLLDT